MSNTNAVAAPMKHASPPLGLVALVFTVLFNAGLSFVISFSPDKPHFPGPWEPAAVIASYFQSHSADVLMCAFLQFGAAIPLGVLTASLVSRLQFLGVRAAGAHIALFGGLAASFSMALSALVLWVMAYPGIANEGPVLRALYYLTFAIGGAGYSVPLGLLIAGVSIPALFLRLLPRGLAIAGLVIAVFGELSWLSLVVPKALFLIPLTRFPGFIWLIATGFMLPRAKSL